MNSTGRHGENSGYLVIMLLVVGLTAFSHSVKKLTEIHQLTLDASRLIAQWSGNVAPVELPQTIVKIEKHESCESKQSAPSVELPWLDEMPVVTEPGAVAMGRLQQSKIQKTAPRVIVRPSEAEIARLKKLHRFEINSDKFEVRVFTDAQNVDAEGPIAPAELPLSMFKARARKHGVIKINPRDHEMLLKTLYRSINLRIAG